MGPGKLSSSDEGAESDYDAFDETAAASLDGPPGHGNSLLSEQCGEAEVNEMSRLEAEAQRKHRLLLKVEANHQAMALLEVQAQERIKQHEASKQIAERELSRVKSELESAQKQKERLAGLQERYDQRLAALKERNLALEKERKQSQRLQSLQKQQETRLQ